MKLFCHSTRLNTGGTLHRIFCCSIRPSSPYSNPISHRKLYLDLAQQFHLIQSSLADTFLTAQDFISPLIELHLRPVFQYQVVDSPKEKIDSLKDCRSHEVTLKTKRTVRDKISSRSCISELRISL